MKLLLVVCIIASCLLVAQAQYFESMQEHMNQQHGGRFVRSPYHHHGGDGGSGGGGHDYGGHVEYGAHTGEKGAFEWHTHHPVGHH